MSFTPYNPYNSMEDELTDEQKQSLRAESAQLGQYAQQFNDSQEAAEAEIRAQEAANLQDSAEPSSDAKPEVSQQTPQSSGQDNPQDTELKMPGDPGTNPIRPPEDEMDDYVWNPEVGEYEMKSGAAVRMVGEAVLAPAAGTVDGFVDTYNYFAPGPDIPNIPKFKNSNLEVIRTVSSYIGPQLIGVGLISKAAKGIQAAGKAPQLVQALGNNPFFKWFSVLGLEMGTGAVVDQANSESTEANLQRQLRTALNTPDSEKLFGIFPNSWATNGTDSPDMKRAKNRNEGMGLGFLSGIADGLVKLGAASKSTKTFGRNIVPKDELAQDYFARIKEGDEFETVKYSDDPVEDALLRSEARTQRNLDELGEFYVAKMNKESVMEGRFQTADELEFTEPVKGIHDSFDQLESGVRNADPDGVTGAMVDAAAIQYNVGTSYGRLGSIVTEAALKWGLEVDNLSKAQLVNAVLDHIQSSGKFDALINDKIITSKQIDEAGTFLAEVMEDMNPGEMRLLLDNYRKMNDDLTVGVVNKVGYDGVFKALKKYQDMFLNLDEKKARALLTTSLAGQASDMAGAVREMDGTAAISAAREQIFDRIEYLMVEKGLASYDAGSTLQSLNVWGRIKSLADPKSASDYVLKQVEAREAYIGQLIPQAKNFTRTMLEVSESNPKFLAPLFDAYHMTDGKVDSMFALTKHVNENLGQIRQAFLKGESEMPNLIIQEFWSNYYNSILSAPATPFKAAVANAGGLITRPISTMAGSMLSGDLRSLSRAWHQYTGITDAFKAGWEHMGFFWKKTMENPMSTMEYGKADLAVKRNEDNIAMLRRYADAAKEQGEFGPQYLLDMYEDMHSIATSPWMRYSANIMGAADAFTRGVIAAGEARGRAYDQLLTPGKRIMPKDIKKVSQQIKQTMFNKDGWISDQAVDYFSREIALNLDSPLAKGVSNIVTNNPWLKPFILFPRTSVNMLNMFGKYSPIAFATKDFWDLVGYGPIERVPMEHMRDFLGRKGLPWNENSVQVFDQMRREAKGRIAVGSLAVGSVSLMVSQDNLRGTGHYDKERQRVRTDLGWRKKTYRGTDGKWYSYELLGPIGDWIAVMADIRDNFDLISVTKQEQLAEKMMYILGAAITDRSVLAMMEPMNDVLSGNGAAVNRWSANFLNSTQPLGSLRNTFGRILSEGLKEVENDLTSLLRNKNNYLDAVDPNGALAKKYDWVDGKEVGYNESFFTRVASNALGIPMADGISPERQFLIDIEYDARPTFMKNRDGIKYSDAERSELYRVMGAQGLFARELRTIMADAERGGFIERLRKARRDGIGGDTTREGNVDTEEFLRIYDRVNQALSKAKRLAENELQSNASKYAAFNQRINEQNANKGVLPSALNMRNK